MQFLDNLNNHINSENLFAMLSALAERSIPTRKAARADLLHRIWLEEPGRILDALSDTERLLLADMVHHNRSYPDLRRFRALYDLAYQWPSLYDRRKNPLIFCFFGAEDRGSLELVEGVQEILKKALPPPSSLRIKGYTDLPATGQWRFKPGWSGGTERIENRELTSQETEHTALIELKRVLQLVAAGKIKVSDATRYPTAATVKQVGAVLAAPDMDLARPNTSCRGASTQDGPEPVRAFAWPVLIQQCGWARAKKGALELTAEGKRMLTAFDPDAFRKGIATWVENTTFDEMRRVSAVKGQTGRRALRTRVAPPVRRNSIMDVLEILPANQWVEIEEAYRGVLATGGDCQVVHDAYCLYMGDPQYGTLGSYTTALGCVYFRQVLGESLATLGLMDIGYAYPHGLHPELRDSWGTDGEAYTCRYDGLKFIRLTPLGRFCVGMKNTYTPPSFGNQSVLTVLPNLEVVITDPATFSAADAVQVSSFAGKVSDAVWRLDRRHVLDALEKGDTAEHILDVLTALARNEMPDTVRRFIEETATRAAAAVKREEATLIHFVDEHTAALVMSDSSAGKAALCRHGNTVVVPVKRIRAFSTALKKMGILPAL